jgi:hypothetical protein
MSLVGGIGSPYRFGKLVLRFYRIWRSYLSPILTNAGLPRLAHLFFLLLQCGAAISPPPPPISPTPPAQFSHFSTITNTAYDSMHVTRDMTVGHSKYTSRSPFLPFLTLHITIQTKVSRSFYSSCSSVDSSDIVHTDFG